MVTCVNTEINKHYSIVPSSVCFHLVQSREATSTLHLLSEELPLHRQVAKRHTVFGRPRSKMLCNLMSMLGHQNCFFTATKNISNHGIFSTQLIYVPLKSKWSLSKHTWQKSVGSVHITKFHSRNSKEECGKNTFGKILIFIYLFPNLYFTVSHKDLLTSS